MKCRKQALVITCVILAILFLSSCSQPKESPAPSIKKVVDMAGRTVEIPAKIKKVYATGPIGTIFMYTLAPDLLVGWNSGLREGEKKYIDPKYHHLPVLGTWRGTKYEGNIEELLKIKPDLIINMGDVDEKYRADTDEIQATLGIPVLMVDGKIENSAAAYKFLGNVLGKTERAAQLAGYCDGVLQDVVKRMSTLPEEKKPKVYYAAGARGLETEARGSLNAEIMDLAGARNVADPGLEKNVRRMQVSLEQLLIWDPEIIIISCDGDEKHTLYNSIINDPGWTNISAVKNGRVYEIPAVPYDWINRPPSVNRIIGIKWLANLLYPEDYRVDIKKETKEFFALFYGYSLNETELGQLFEYAAK